MFDERPGRSVELLRVNCGPATLVPVADQETVEARPVLLVDGINPDFLAEVSHEVPGIIGLAPILSRPELAGIHPSLQLFEPEFHRMSHGPIGV